MAIGRVLVTGGSGRVGRYVLRELVKDYDVVNGDREPPAAAAGEYLALDVLDLDAVRRAVKGVTAIVHLAAIDYDWNAAPEVYIGVNTIGTWNVLQAAAESGVRKVVLCSSISACGLSEMRPDWTPQYLPVDERHENRPVHAYSVSKIVIEQMGRSFAQGSSGMSVICLRPMAVVLRETIADFLSFIDAPDRKWLFYYVTAEDLARGFGAALRSEGLRFGVFFMSAADTCRPEATLDWYRSRIGMSPELANPRLYQRDPRASIFSSARARDLLGWEPSSNFEAIRKEWLTTAG